MYAALKERTQVSNDSLTHNFYPLYFYLLVPCSLLLTPTWRLIFFSSSLGLIFFFLDKYLLPDMECIIASALISLARKLYPGTIKGK